MISQMKTVPSSHTQTVVWDDGAQVSKDLNDSGSMRCLCHQCSRTYDWPMVQDLLTAGGISQSRITELQNRITTMAIQKLPVKQCLGCSTYYERSPTDTTRNRIRCGFCAEVRPRINFPPRELAEALFMAQ